MPTLKRYLTVLKGKQGELRALSRLLPDVKQSILPLIEIIPPTTNNAGVVKPIQEHIHHEVERLAGNWGTDERVLVDARHLPVGGASHPLSILSERAHALDLGIVTVTSTTAPRSISDPAAYARREYGHGVCLRESTASVVADDYVRDIDRTLYDLGASPGETDFVLDVGHVRVDQQLLMPRFVATAISRIPYMSQWRSLSMTASSFPASLSHLQRGISRVPRGEWSLWTALRSLLPASVPMPNFGDYAVLHPDLTQGRWPGSATIRYTTTDSTLVVRGRGLATHGAGQYVELAQDLVGLDAYAGATFSWGDGYVRACAQAQAGPGNATKWIEVGVNHHITFVVRQLLAQAAAGAGGI